MPIKSGFLIGILSVVFTLLIAEIGFRVYQRISLSTSILGLQGVTASDQSDARPRILAGGASSMLGAPYDFKINMPFIIRDYLKTLHPPHEVELELVANSGYSLEGLFVELMQALSRRPAMFFLYAGHNEFLGNIAPDESCTKRIQTLYSLFGYSKLFRWMIGRFARLGIERPPTYTRELFDDPIVCPERRQELLDDYRRRILVLARYAKSLNIPTIFVFPAGNEADFDPNRSLIEGDEQRQSKIRGALACGQWHKSQDEQSLSKYYYSTVYKEAPEFALGAYSLGEALRAEGDLTAANKLFEKAKELDGYPWRALQEQWSAIEEAGQLYGVHTLNAREILFKASPTGYLDKTLFHDIHHPTLKGYHAIAQEVLKIILKEGLLGVPNDAKLEFVSDIRLAERFRFSNGDWFTLLFSRAEWMREVIPITFDPTVRIKVLFDYIHGMRLLDNQYYIDNIQQMFPETRYQQLIMEKQDYWRNACKEFLAGQEHDTLSREERELTSKTQESLEVNQAPSLERPTGKFETSSSDKHLNYLEYFSIGDKHPVHISGVPSVMRHQLGAAADGKGSDGLSLRANHKDYERGFASHPTGFPSEQTFILDSKYTEFVSMVGVADMGTERSSVICDVVLDGKVAHTTPLLKWQQELVEVKVSVLGVDEMRLRCNNGGDSEEADHAVWIEPELK